MSRFLIFLLGAILGAVLGGALIFYLYVGAPRAAQVPGAPIKPPDAAGVPAGTATVVLNQEFFNTVLAAIFRDMNAPAFPLNLTGQTADSGAMKFASFQNACDGKITLKPEGSGVVTGVRFENGELLAPLAFTGSTSVFGSCLNFTGWAQARMDLRFDEATQTVFGQINVQTVNLDGITPLASGFVTPLVQNTLNQRVNPIPVLRGEQIRLNLPITAAQGNLQAAVKDVRAEVKDNALHLFVTYNFTGTKGN